MSKTSPAEIGRALALELSIGLIAPLGMAVTAVSSTAAYAQSIETAAQLVAALQMDQHYAGRVDAVIAETKTLPRLWSGSANADTAELRQKLARQRLLKMKPQVLAAVGERIASAYSEEEQQNYLLALKGGPAPDHPMAYGVDFIFTDVILNALIMISPKIDRRVQGQ